MEINVTFDQERMKEALERAMQDSLHRRRLLKGDEEFIKQQLVRIVQETLQDEEVIKRCINIQTDFEGWSDLHDAGWDPKEVGDTDYRTYLEQNILKEIMRYGCL